MNKISKPKKLRNPLRVQDPQRVATAFASSAELLQPLTDTTPFTLTGVKINFEIILNLNFKYKIKIMFEAPNQIGLALLDTNFSRRCNTLDTDKKKAKENHFWGKLT